METFGDDGTEANKQWWVWLKNGAEEIEHGTNTCLQCQTALASLKSFSGTVVYDNAAGVFEYNLFECQSCHKQYCSKLSMVA